MHGQTIFCIPKETFFFPHKCFQLPFSSQLEQAHDQDPPLALDFTYLGMREQPTRDCLAQRLGVISKAGSEVREDRAQVTGRAVIASHTPKGRRSQDLGCILNRKKTLGLP